MLIDKAEIERVKRGNELVSFIHSRGITLTPRGKQLVGLLADCPDCIVLAKKMLSKDAAKLFERVMRGWLSVHMVLTRANCSEL